MAYPDQMVGLSAIATSKCMRNFDLASAMTRDKFIVVERRCSPLCDRDEHKGGFPNAVVPFEPDDRSLLGSFTWMSAGIFARALDRKSN
jgi:hypothetical protein